MTCVAHQQSVLVLYNSGDRLIKGDPRDLLAEQAVIACARAVSSALDEAGFHVEELALSGDLEPTLRTFPPHEWTVFNLAEGLNGKLFEEARIAWALDAMGYPFTGSNGEALARSTNKARAKALFRQGGVRTPGGWVVGSLSDVDALQRNGLGFPVIVKPIAEDASLGISQKAVVRECTGLKDQIDYILSSYCQAALIEEFIPGREFNVALWGNPVDVLPLAEIDFSDFEDPLSRIVAFDAKWEESSFAYHHTPAICPARVDQPTARRITAAALRAWEVIGCRGYARVDLRVREDGTPFVIEVNCNPDISPDVGFHNTVKAAGLSYRDMVVRILDSVERNRYV